MTTNFAYYLPQTKTPNTQTPKNLDYQDNNRINKIYSAITTSIYAASIGIATVIIVPVGLLGGMVGGTIMFDSGGLSKNPIIQPMQITVTAILGASSAVLNYQFKQLLA